MLCSWLISSLPFLITRLLAQQNLLPDPPALPAPAPGSLHPQGKPTQVRAQDSVSKNKELKRPLRESGQLCLHREPGGGRKSLLPLMGCTFAEAAGAGGRNIRGGSPRPPSLGPSPASSIAGKCLDGASKGRSLLYFTPSLLTSRKPCEHLGGSLHVSPLPCVASVVYCHQSLPTRPSPFT